MTVQEIPEPEDCLFCQDARSCPVTSFETSILTDPQPTIDQSLADYLSSLCDCGQQLVPAITWDIPTRVEHTKLCKEHTVRWLQKVIKLKEQFNPKDYQTEL